jgi:signal transduction histidine kinase
VFFIQQTKIKKLTFNIHDNSSAHVPVIHTDKIKLGSIISNLLKNAIKFTNSGSVDFGSHISSDGSILVFYVADTGPGIETGSIDTIFNRFIQADMSDTRAHEGSGLGLSIVKAYVDLLGGKVWVESEVGKGSIFSFSLPLP